MRKFFIENENGTRYALNGENNIWFTEPKGLGITFDVNSANLSGGFFKTTYMDTRQNSVTGNVTFLKNVYPSYQTFSTFLLMASTLYLIYQPTDTQYRAQVRVNFLTKSEINRGRWLQVPVSFTLMTPWYLPSPVEFSVVPIPADVMRYDWEYGDAVYGTVGANMTVIIPPNGHIPASWDLTYTGELQHPVILITGQSSGTVYGRIEIETNIAANDTLTISTRYLDSFIKSAAQGDLIKYVDLSYDPYPRLPLSETVSVSMTATNTISGELKMNVNNYYRTV